MWAGLTAFGPPQYGADAELKPFLLTHALYPGHSRFYQLLAFLSVTHFAVLSALLGIFFVNREMLTALMFLGQVLNELLNNILKRWVAQLRPENPVLGLNSYGMPSGHSQFAGFFAGWVIMYLGRYQKLPGARGRSLQILLMYAYAFGVAWSRVALGYHTVFQVVVGVSLGFVLGQAWFRFVQSRPCTITQRVKRTVVDSQLGQMLGLRDSYAVWFDGGQAQSWATYVALRKEKTGLVLRDEAKTR